MLTAVCHVCGDHLIVLLDAVANECCEASSVFIMRGSITVDLNFGVPVSDEVFGLKC